MVDLVRVGIGIGAAIDIAIGCEVKPTEMCAAKYFSNPDFDRDPDYDTDPDATRAEALGALAPRNHR